MRMDKEDIYENYLRERDFKSDLKTKYKAAGKACGTNVSFTISVATILSKK